MKATRKTWLSIYAALASITLFSSVAALVALNTGGEAALGPVVVMKIAAGYDRRAEALLVPTLRGADARARAAQLSHDAVSQFPYDTGAWLRLAYLDALEHGGLTSQGTAWVKRSYDLVAIDPDVGLWRVRFVLENSGAITPEIRSAARTETAALWSAAKNRQVLRDMAQTLHNPAGRLSLALWLNRLEHGVT